MTDSKFNTKLRESDRFISDTFQRALLPAIASIGGVMASTLANSLIAGNLLGESSLAVLSIVNPIYFVFATIGSLAGAGAASVAAWCIGQDDDEGCRAAVTLAALLSLALSFLLAVCGLIFLKPLTAALGADGELFGEVADYAAVYLFSGIGIAGIYPPYFLLKLDGRHRASMALFVGLAIGCVGLELFCVLVLKMGLTGVAWGCTAANIVTALTGWAILLGRKSSFRLTSPARIKKNGVKMLMAGSPAALNNLCSVLRTVSLNLAIASLAGKIGLSAFGIISMASNLSLIFINGLTQTTGPFVGVFTGEHDNVSLIQLEKQAFKWGMMLIIPATAALIVFAPTFCRVFGVADSETLSLATTAVRLFALSMPPAMLSSIMMNYYLSAGRTWLANVITLCRSYIMIYLSLKLLCPPLGINGVWLSFAAAELLTWLTAAAALILFLKKTPTVFGILLLDKRFSSDDGCISFSVNATQEDIMNASQRISDFCEKNALPDDKAMLISLSIEEMLISIKDHCFADAPEQEINVRIAVGEKKGADMPVLMRIRCSGEPFNPIEYYEKHREISFSEETADSADELLEDFSELEDSLGIAMIVSSAPVVDYKTTFGVNNLMITI